MVKGNSQPSGRMTLTGGTERTLIGRPSNQNEDEFYESVRTTFKTLETAYDHFGVMNNFVAEVFWTGTFRRTELDGSPSKRISVERTEYLFRLLVRRLNEDMGGLNYQRKWGHSYFGYVFGMDIHADGIFHCHAVMDNWINYKLAHILWNRWAGFSWIRPVVNSEIDTKYVLKYVVKSDRSPTFFFQSTRQVRNRRTGLLFPENTGHKGSSVKGREGTAPTDLLALDTPPVPSKVWEIEASVTDDLSSSASLRSDRSE